MGIRVFLSLVARTVFGGSDFEGADLGVADGVGVVVGVDALDVGFAFLEIQMLDVGLLAAMNVDGLFVEKYQRAGKIDSAEDGGRSCDVDDHKIIAGHVAPSVPV